jgi:hypothetical protein
MPSLVARRRPNLTTARAAVTLSHDLINTPPSERSAVTYDLTNTAPSERDLTNTTPSKRATLQTRLRQRTPHKSKEGKIYYKNW